MRPTPAPDIALDEVLAPLWQVLNAARPEAAGDAVGVERAVQAVVGLHQAWQALRQERDQLRDVYDSSFQFQGVLAPDGTLLDANATTLAFAGTRRVQVLGRPLWDAPWWPPGQTTTLTLRTAVTHAARGEFFRADVEMVGQDGRPSTIDLSLTPVLTAGGQVAFIIFEGRDVTEHRRIARAAELERTFLKSVLDNVQDGIVACDAQGRLTVFNRSSQEIHGLGAMAEVPELWTDRFSLFAADGVTPLPTDQVPLFRALQGEQVRDAEMMIVPAQLPARSVVASGTPLRAADGHILGAVVAMYDVTERKRIEARLRHEALHDALTQLPNRTLLCALLHKSMARSTRQADASYALLFLDLDDFKLVNDVFGHQGGDQLLTQVAARLTGAVRATDTVARLGGDEFAVLLDTPGDTEQALRVAGRIRAALARPFDVQGRSMDVTTSIGVALGSPHYAQVDEPLRDADTAMYHAKRSGKNVVTLFEAGMHAQMVERLNTVQELRLALERDELTLHYQPVVRLDDGACVGFEALVRWQHPRRGLLAPGAFIGVAEDTGLIAPLGCWVLEAAAAQLQAWRRHPALQHLHVTVNLSGEQLKARHDPHQRLLGFEFPAGLALEVTESCLVASPEASGILRSLAERGVPLLLDDFGTGYASLAAVQRHPFSALKVDRSFVAALSDQDRDRAITASVLTMAAHLGLKAVAEGVETAGQREVLLELGCRHAQGYLFSPPLPADQALAYALQHPLGMATAQL